jgi:hypothetical protein
VDELLLSDPSAALRHRVLTELMDVPADDPEVADLARRRLAEPELTELLAAEPADLKELIWQLCRLAHLGLDRAHPRVRELAGRLLDRQQPDGSFRLTEFRPEGLYQMVPLQVSLPLRGLAAAGYATDPRVEKAYDWLLAQRLEDGSWPTGRASGQPGYVAGYRRLPGAAGCRANTEAAVAALVLHPRRRTGDDTRRALNLLLRRETRDESAIGVEVSRLCGFADASGFFTFYARFDLAFVLELAGRAGVAADDRRVAELVGFLEARRGPAGLWEHPQHPELSRWLTFELLSSLRRLTAGDWVSEDPRFAF